MITYRDMTFCNFNINCLLAKDCPRALTKKVQEDADKWWGKGKNKAPIAQFTSKPKCHEIIGIAAP